MNTSRYEEHIHASPIHRKHVLTRFIIHCMPRSMKRFQYYGDVGIVFKEKKLKNKHPKDNTF